MERLLKPMEVAELLAIGRSRIYEMLASGEIPSIKLGRLIRIPSSQLAEWIEKNSTQNTKKQEA